MSHFLYVHKKIISNAIMMFHFLWVGILITGAAISSIFEWYRPIYFAIVLTTIISQLLFLGCPLTTLEEAMRNYGEEKIEGFKGGFLIYYLDKWFGLRPSKVVIATATWLLLAFSTALFIFFLIDYLID